MLQRLILLAISWPALAMGQSFEPVKMYNGYGRDLLANADFEGAGRVLLLDHENNEVAAAEIKSGEVDLAELFPQFWTRWDADLTPGQPIQDPELWYAQLEVDGERVGAAIVCQPTISPSTAFSQGRAIQWSPRVSGRVVYSGLRLYEEQHVVLETSMGSMEFRMRPDEAPNSAFNFLHLVEGGYYDGIIFHRVVELNPQGNPFVIQAGDPTGTGSGGPGYMIDLEDSKLKHTFGVLSMARSSDPDSNGSQFFVCLSREGTNFLDGNYTAFGEAVGGASTIIELSKVEVGPGDRPVEPPVIERARLIDAPPRGQSPAPVTRP